MNIFEKMPVWLVKGWHGFTKDKAAQSELIYFTLQNWI
jgi:hypothetical protein